MSMTRRILFVGGSETWAMFVCIEVCVGKVCLYSNYSTIRLIKNVQDRHVQWSVLRSFLHRTGQQSEASSP